MKKPRIAVAVGYLDDDLVSEAVEYKPVAKRKIILWQYVAAAVCLCAAVGITVMLAYHVTNNQVTVWPGYTLPEVQELYVELSGYDYDRGKLDTVIVDAGDNTVFPVGTVLKFNFMVWTEVYLSDGTQLDFDVEEIQLEELGWKPGTILRVQFRSYAEYHEWDEWSMLDPYRVEVVKEP